MVVSVHVVAGTAGAGKTSLVLHWAHQVKDRFPDGQLFVNLRGYDPGEPVTAGQALRHFLRALGVTAVDVPEDTDAAAALYRSLLSDRRMLIVLDNAATAAQVRPLLPGGGDNLVLVTSRNRLAGLAVRDSARRLTLGTLPEPEAVALLRAVTRDYRPGEDEEKLGELARLCARLPLALRIAAERAAAHPHMRLDDLIADLRDESALWDTLSTGTDEDADAVRTVFTWSYRALPSRSSQVFRLLGLHPGPEFSLHAAAALADLPLSRTRQLLEDLVGAHLLEQTAPDRYQFHDLLRAYATERAQAEEPPEKRAAATRRVLDWYLHTADAARTRLKLATPYAPLSASTASVPAAAFGDFDAAADWSEREKVNFPHLVRAADSAGLHTLTWQLALAFRAMPPSSPYGDWLGIGHTGLAAAERTGHSGARMQLLTELGMALRLLNRLDEAQRCHERALELARASANRLEEGRSLNLLGLIQLRLRQLGAAETHFEEAEVVFREQGDRHRAAMALSNLARTRLTAGLLPEAASTIERALTVHRVLDNQRSIGNALNIAAELSREHGRLEAAREAVDQALGIALSLRNRRLEAFWLLTLGDVQRATGEFGDALGSFQRSAMLHRRLGDRSREALAWRGAGRTYAAIDRPHEAAAFHRQATAVHRGLGDAWELAVELDCLASVLPPEDSEAATACWAEALALLAPYPDPRAAALRSRIVDRG